MNISSDPKGRGITVTIKYGKGYEDTWAVFHGLHDEIFADILTYFGMDGDAATDLTLSDLVVNATNMAHAVGNVAATLGGTVITQPTGVPASAMSAAPRRDAWTEATAASATPAEPTAHPLLQTIGQAPDVAALKRLWAENQEAFADPTVMNAWKAKGKALSGAT